VTLAQEIQLREKNSKRGTLPTGQKSLPSR
jgi:hypothetical protein